MQSYESGVPQHQQACPAVTAAPHIASMLEKLKRLKEMGKYCDVVLHMGEKTVEAHRNVLAAWSPYFDSVLSGSDIEREHVTVACQNHEDAFLQLVEFMYTGRAMVRDTNVAHLLSLADQFKIEPLKGLCEEFLRGNIHIKNFVTVFGLSRRFRLNSLQANITSFVQQNLSEATKQPEFNSLTPNLINAFVAMDPMSALKPEYKVFLIVGWISADFENREKYLSLLFSKVAWPGLSNNFLAEISKSENFFTSNLSCLFLLLRSVNKAGLPLGPYTDGFPHLRDKNKDYCMRTQVERLPDVLDDEPITAIVICKTKDQPASDNTGNELIGHEAKESQTVPLEDGTSQTPMMDSDSESETVDDSIDQDWKPMVSEDSRSPSYSPVIKGSTAKYPVRATRRKGIPVKMIGEYDVSDVEKKATMKRKKTPVCKTEPNIEDVEQKLSVDLKKKRRGRPRKNLLFPKQPKKLLTQRNNDTSVKRSRGRPRKVMKSECGENDQSGLAEEEGQGGEKPLSIRDRNTWKRCDEPGCPFTTGVIETMEEHISTAHQREKNQCCNICEFKSSYNRIYYTHMKEHFEGPPYCCDHPLCSYKADRIQPLLTHRMIHTDERPYECKICKTKFRSTIYLQIHERQHTGEKPFSCDICERSFSTKGTLDQHLISHTTQRPFLCDTCGFATKYQSHLIAHKRIHTGEVFRCRYPNCVYSTPKRSQMKAHMRSHLSIRSHTCTICGRAFVEKSHLVRHEKIHLAEKPHKCDQCEYSSSRRDKLKEHLLKHHSIESSVSGSPYKPRRPRRQKDPVPISTTSEDAQILLEQMVECSAPNKLSSETLNEEELANIQQLQQEQRRVLENAQEEQRRQLEQKQEEERRRMLETEPINALPPERIDTLPPTHLPQEMELAHIQHIYQNNHGHLPPAQHLQQLQTPHMSVSIVGGDGSHLSHDAVAFVQSVAESVVMDTAPPIMAQAAQTTTLNNLTITTLELR